MPQKLPRKIAVRELVVKAMESATLAVEVYNKPKVEFRTGAYCTLMVIAWTALLHAVFERDGVKYFYREKNGRYKRRDGDRLAWELAACVKTYWKDDLESGVVKNLQLFIQLRNKIEHRGMRSVDAYLMPEAQALLLNFKNFLAKEFQIEFLGDMGLYVPISVFSAKRTIPQSADERAVLDFIDTYRGTLDPRLWDHTDYAFRAYLVPKVGNHENSSDVTIEFVKADGLDENRKRRLTRVTALIKAKQTPFDAALLKPQGVVALVKVSHPEFTMSRFVNAWKKLGIRPSSKSDDPGDTDTRYCYYDPVDNDYRYESVFANLICEHIAKGEEFLDDKPLGA